MANLRAPRPSQIQTGTPLIEVTPDPASENGNSPTPSQSSDKENTRSRRKMDKGKGKAQDAAAKTRANLPTPDSEGRANKRQKLSERDGDSNARRRGQSEFYDPNQDASERRANMLQMRRNYKELHDRHDVIVNQPEVLADLVKRQDEAYKRVVQTSDATLDSRFLVQVSDIALKQATTLASGETSAGLDMDEFVSKCITFMRYGGDDTDRAGRTQARRREQEEADENGDALSWHLLGRRAASFNRRPAAPCFLLGPLSVQKRVRAPTQRTQRSRRDAQAVATKPQEIQAADLQSNEKNNLTHLCAGIRTRLQTVIEENSQAVERDFHVLEEQSQLEGLDETEFEARQLAVLREHKLADNWEVSLFEFAFNPKSFAQTVENLFYVSFLIRDGHVMLSTDSHGLPTVRWRDKNEVPEEDAPGQRKKKGPSRHQAIFSLDYQTWHKIIQAFDIKEPMIEHRAEELGLQAPGARGWYG